ncbi:MAG TPA: FtsH protease activity modulator HflK [Alphaproteobacteria bacterium]|nr:FtsH protease activity modulator HflK [Alphaproteobacteria bacterium]
MSWNDKGGGPWGSPPSSNGPRGRQPPQGDGPNDIEQMLRRGQDRMRDLLPGGFGGGRTILAIIAAGLLIWIATGIYRVDPNEEAVVQRFGAWDRTESLGLHYHLPAPIETVTMVDVTGRHQTEIGSMGIRDTVDASTMLTGDRNIVEVDFVIVWQVMDPVKYLFRVSEPEALLQRAAQSAMREVIGQTDVQQALNEGRRKIELDSAAILQSTLDRYESGIRVAAIQLQKVDPPQPVVDAFNDVQRALSEKEQQRNEAEKYRNDILPRARGDATKAIQDAEGYKTRVVAEANGEAQQFLSVLNAYKASRDVTARRLYIETMEQILQHSRKIILDPSIDAKTGVVPYLPLPTLPAPARGGQ